MSSKKSFFTNKQSLRRTTVNRGMRTFMDNHAMVLEPTELIKDNSMKEVFNYDTVQHEK